MAAGQIGPVMVSETGSGGKLMMRAVVDSIEEITTLSRLRKEESFQRASKVLQEVWLTKLGRVKGKGENPSSKRSTRKVLFLWTLTQMKSLTSQLMVPEGFCPEDCEAFLTEAHPAGCAATASSNAVKEHRPTLRGEAVARGQAETSGNLFLPGQESHPDWHHLLRCENLSLFLRLVSSLSI